MAGPWEKYGGASQPAPIIGPPKLPAPQTPAQAEKDVLDVAKTRADIAKAPLEQQKLAQDVAETQQKLDARQKAAANHSDYAKSVLGAIGEARGNTSGFSTGIVGQLLDNIGGTQAHDLQSNINTVVANIGFDRLQQMRAESPTGGALGQVSDFENRMLQSSLTALNQSQSRDQFLKHLDAVEFHYLNVLNTLEGKQPFKSLDEAREAYAPIVGTAPSAAPSGPQGGGDNPPGPRRLTPEQQTEFFNILETQGADAADAYARQFGLSIQNKEGPHSNQIQYSDLGRSFAVGAGGVAEGVGDLLGVVSNPFISGVNALTGTNYRPDMGANLRDLLGLPAPQNDREQFISTVNNYGTQALGVANAARLAATRVPGIVGDALGRLGAAPLTDSAAGATGGAASDLTRQQGGGPLLQALAGVAGGASSLPVSGFVNRLATAERAVPQVVRAGQAEGVNVNRAMVDKDLQPKLTAVGKTMTGSRMMQRDMRGIGSQIEDRVKALSGGGEALREPSALGGAAQTIGRRYIKASGAEFKRLYGDLRKDTASVGVRLTGSEAIAHVDSILARLAKAPNQNAKEISYLEGLKSDIANGIDVDTARDIGSRLSRDISKGDVTFGKSEADVLDIRKALSRDVENGLTSAGRPDLAAKYREVDAAYSRRMDFIKQKLQTLLGKREKPLEPETAAGRLNAMAGQRGDSAGLYQILSRATQEERADIAATFAESLGRNKDGAFSTAKFVSDLAAMPPAARVAIFGKDGAKSLENLTTLAAEHKRVSHALGGSPTALAQDYRGFLLNLVLGGGTGLLTSSGMKGAAVAAGGLALKMGRDAINAKLLMSPKITGWLRSAPKTSNPQAINSHFDRLKAIAVREPALAPEIQRLQELIMRAANDRATPGVAASGTDQGDQDN